MNAEQRRDARKQARRAASKYGHADKYADRASRPAEETSGPLSDALARLAHTYRPEWARQEDAS